MGGWFSITSLGGMAIAAAFMVVACRNLERGLAGYALLGALPFFQVAAYSGNEMVQGIPLAEVRATALFGAWLLQHHRYPLGRLRSFERWLLLLLPASVLSLASGLAWLDRDVPQQNVKMSVSIGQILLFAWPMAVYFVTSRIVERTPGIERWFKYVLWLAVPQLVSLTVPAARPYVSWSIYFGLIAAPLAFARATYETDWRKVVGLCLFGLPPLLEGLWTGKAFLYGYVVIAAVAIGALRARRALGLALPAIGLVATLVLMVPEGTPLPGPLEGLLEEERSQQSWGGDTGRGQLMADALNIWARYPVLGVGPANSYPYMLRYSLLGTPHSQYADLILECGVIGLGIVLVFIGGALVTGLSALKRPVDQERDIFLVAWVGSFFGLSVLSITGDYMLHSIRNGGIEMFTGFYLHWVFLGTAMGIIRREEAATAASMGRLPLAWRPRAVNALVGRGAR
jgi:hypothetical protein